jgi:hypothetical protein
MPKLDAGDVVTSLEQDGWREIAATIRSGLKAQARLIQAFKDAGEMSSFISACCNAMALEQAASAYDQTLSRMLREFD